MVGRHRAAMLPHRGRFRCLRGAAEKYLDDASRVGVVRHEHGQLLPVVGGDAGTGRGNWSKRCGEMLVLLGVPTGDEGKVTGACDHDLSGFPRADLGLARPDRLTVRCTHALVTEVA